MARPKTRARVTVSKRCANCLYWEGKAEDIGQCHRWPELISKRPSGWCGEYKVRPNRTNKTITE